MSRRLPAVFSVAALLVVSTTTMMAGTADAAAAGWAAVPSARGGGSVAFATPSASGSRRRNAARGAFSSQTLPSSSSALPMAVESITMDGVSDDHDAVGSEMKGSVIRWLDSEWMEQEVHVKMADSCMRSYIRCRREGIDDLMAIMVQVADDLQSKWYEEYDADAFVSSWDVANYVSDYLAAQTGAERCECSARIH